MCATNSARLLEACIDELRESDRQLLKLRYQHEKTVQQIAEECSRPKSTIHDLLEKIRGRLLRVCSPTVSELIDCHGIEFTTSVASDWTLTSRLCDGELVGEEFVELATLLDGNPAAMAEYLAYTSLHLDLGQRLQPCLTQQQCHRKNSHDK